MAKIALIGSAPSSMGLAPYANPNWQIWACSPGTYYQLPRCDAFFELHRWEPGVIGKPNTQKPWYSPEYVAWMGKQPLVWMFQPVPEIPGSRAVPFEELNHRWGSYFWTSSLAYMLAMALDVIITERMGRVHAGLSKEQCDELATQDAVGLWGVDMAACPHPDTKVLTADLRWVRAGDLQLDQELIAFDEEAQPGVGGPFPKRMWRKAKVLRNTRITKPCYKITLEDGCELICSDEHKWLTYSENGTHWRMAKDLVTPHHRADRPTRIVKACDVWEEDKSWGAGYLAAALDGEGHLTQKLREGDYATLRVGFAQRENAMSAMFTDLMAERGFDFGPVAKAIGDNNDCQKYILRGGRTETMKLMGQIRPRRLLAKFDPENLGIFQKEDTIAVVKSEFIGDQEVVGLTTSTGTFIAEGLATHNTEEYGFQRAGCQHFLAEANRLAIMVVVPPESDLLRPMPPYGLFESTHFHIKNLARLNELQARHQQTEVQVANLTQSLHFLKGAIDNQKYHMDTWGDDRQGMAAAPEIAHLQAEGIADVPAPPVAYHAPLPDVVATALPANATVVAIRAPAEPAQGVAEGG